MAEESTELEVGAEELRVCLDQEAGGCKSSYLNKCIYYLLDLQASLT